MDLSQILNLLGQGGMAAGGTLATAGLGSANIPVAAAGAGLAGLGSILSAYNQPQQQAGAPQGGGGPLEALLGSPESRMQYPRYAPEQMQFIQQLLPLLMGELQQGQNLDFAPIAQQAEQRFQQETVPSLAARFTAGTGGRSTSPSLVNQLGRAGAQMQTNLAAQQAQYGLGAEQLRNQRLNSLLAAVTQPAYAAENIIRKGQQGAINPQTLNKFGSWLTSYLQNPKKKDNTGQTGQTGQTGTTLQPAVNQQQNAIQLLNQALANRFMPL